MLIKDATGEYTKKKSVIVAVIDSYIVGKCQNGKRIESNRILAK
jgi:hypothetical protein